MMAFARTGLNSDGQGLVWACVSQWGGRSGKQPNGDMPSQPKLMKLTGTRFPNESFSFEQIATCHICHSRAMIQSWYLALKVIIEA